MSTTTTSNPLTYTLTAALADYTVHHTGSEDTPTPPPSTSSPLASPQVSAPLNPPSWPTDHNRIPPYRPINTSLSFSERPIGSNAAESVVIAVMFMGVGVQAVSCLFLPFFIFDF